MLQPVNVATPATAVSGLLLHVGVAPAGVVIANVTALVSVTAVFPAASCTVTMGCFANAEPVVESLGWVENTSCAPGPAVMVKAVLSAGVRAPSVAVKVYVPTSSMLQ